MQRSTLLRVLSVAALVSIGYALSQFGVLPSATKKTPEKSVITVSTYPASPELVDQASAYLNSMIIRDVSYTAAHSIDVPENSYAGFVSGPAPALSLDYTIEHLAPLPPCSVRGNEVKRVCVRECILVLRNNKSDYAERRKVKRCMMVNPYRIYLVLWSKRK